MRKNKFIFIALVLSLLLVIGGCTAQNDNPERAQTRIGLDNNDGNLRRNEDNNMMNNDGSNLGRNTDNNNIMNNDEMDARNNTNNNQSNFNNANNNNNNFGERADKIVKKVTELKDVQNAAVLITDETAIIGVEMSDNIEGNMTDDLKNKIERAVKNTDKNIDTVSITADPDLFTRIGNMATNITDGKPLSGFGNEIEEILRRINPIR